MNRTLQFMKFPTLAALPLPAALRRHEIFTSDHLLRNILSLTGTELSTRVSRIVAMIFVARALSPEMFGLAALALSSHEIIKVLTQNGIFQMIIKSDEKDIDAVCARAHQINFIVCWLTAILQLGVGAALWMLMDAPQIFAMGAALSVVFVIMPFGLVRLALASRANELHKFSRIVHRQTTLENALALALALVGGGAWALVLPRALSMPLWVHGALASNDWRYERSVEKHPLAPFREFCFPLFISETLKAGRAHLDKALIVTFLGVEALGVYFFAMNAGLGLSLTLGKAVSTCLMPHLCEKARAGENVWQIWNRLAPSLLAGGMAIFTVQAIAALYYVPFLYGEQWLPHASLVAILCLAATPRFAADCTVQLLRTFGQTKREAATTAAVTIASIIAITAGALSAGVMGAAIALVVAAWTVEMWVAWKNHLSARGIVS